jgi:hypothetical protein
MIPTLVTYVSTPKKPILLYSPVHLIMGKAADVSHFLYEVLVAHPIIDEGHHHLQGKNESNDYRTQKKTCVKVKTIFVAQRRPFRLTKCGF